MSGKKRLSFSSSTKTTSHDQQTRGQQSEGQQSEGQQSQATLVSSSSPVFEREHVIESTLQERQLIENPVTEKQKQSKFRGATRNLGIEKLVAKDGKLSINYRETELRVHGTHASKFANAIGSIVRHYCPLHYSGWRNVPDDAKKVCIEKLKKKSVAGASNREKSGAYMGGSKSLIQHLNEYPNTQSSSDSTSSGKYLDVFKLTHWSEKHGWQTDRAEADYQRLMEVRNERLSQLPEGSQLDSDDEEDIYSQVLINERYEKYEFKCGTGPVIKKRQLSGSGGTTQRLLVENLRTEVADHKQRVI
ncbi:hypothetical protein TIFTF001_042349, partial [Ficus carica]